MDDIERAFLDITPEDFFRDTSATTTLKHPKFMLNEGMTTTEVNFHHFVNAMLIGAKTKANSDEGFHAFSVLHNATEQRYFRPDDDETSEIYAKRLAREAETMHATWFFNALLGPGRAFETDDAANQPTYDPTPEGVLDALTRGILQIGICWTATYRCDVPHHIAATCLPGEHGTVRRGGIVYLDGGVPGEEIEGDVTPASDVFYNVLEGSA